MPKKMDKGVHGLRSMSSGTLAGLFSDQIEINKIEDIHGSF